MGSSGEVSAPAHGLSLRGTSDDQLFSGDVVRKLLVKMETQADLSQPARLPPPEASVRVKVRERASRRAVKQDSEPPLEPPTVAVSGDATIGAQRAAELAQAQLAALYERNPGAGETRMSVAAGNFLDWQQGSSSFENIPAYATRAVTVAPEVPALPEMLYVATAVAVKLMPVTLALLIVADALAGLNV